MPRAQADSSLASYRTRAHGFVFFLAQVGEGLREPPRLVKADELRVEVYWRAPDRSKQVILGWRDGAFLPTDIDYHRDHLGIVTNNFGDVIRIGEGDEVRDVPHPLSPAGLAAYDYALGDSLAIRTARGETVVREVQVRPRSFARPLVVGTLYLDAVTAQLVRFRFSFTPAAYLDRQLEDISIVLENSLYEQRYWLPYRQEVEIRRRTSWLDFPARGIIRGRWEIEGYDLNVPLPDALFQGPAIAGLLHPRPADSSWTTPLGKAIAGEAAPVNQQDMDALRVEVERIAGARALSGLSSRRLAAGSVSDVVHVNRVQGLTLGFGGVLGLRASRIQVRPSLAYGTSDHRVTGALTVAAGLGATQVTARRLPPHPRLQRPAGDRAGGQLPAGPGRRQGLRRLRPAPGRDRRAAAAAERAFDARAVGGRRGEPVRRRPGDPGHRELPTQSRAGLGDLARGAPRARAGERGHRGAAGLPGTAQPRGRGGPRRLRAGDAREPVAHDPRRPRPRLAGLPRCRDRRPAAAPELRGRRPGNARRRSRSGPTAAARWRWRRWSGGSRCRYRRFPLGSFASTGRSMTVAPFLAAGVTGRPMPGLPWTGSDGVRPVVGVALEWFMRLIRVEAGVGLRDGGFGLTVDVNRDWWGLL